MSDRPLLTAAAGVEPRSIYSKLYETMGATCDLLFVAGELRPNSGEELSGMSEMCRDMQVRLKRLADAEGRVLVPGVTH